MKDLVTLPGVGRKTANVVLGNGFGIPGITVDTHFGRLVRRFGWTTETDPDKVEVAVAALFPPKDWTQLCHNVIWHGAGAAMPGTRRAVPARSPAGAPRTGKERPTDQGRQAGSGAAGMMRTPPAAAAAVLAMVLAGCSGSPVVAPPTPSSRQPRRCRARSRQQILRP